MQFDCQPRIPLGIMSAGLLQRVRRHFPDAIGEALGNAGAAQRFESAHVCVDSESRMTIPGVLQLIDMVGRLIDAVFRDGHDVAIHRLLLGWWPRLHDAIESHVVSPARLGLRDTRGNRIASQTCSCSRANRSFRLAPVDKGPTSCSALSVRACTPTRRARHPTSS